MGLKGRHNYYYYYHCIAACGTIYKAEEMNENFVMQLEDLIPKPGRAELYRELIKDLFLQQSGSQNFERKSLLAQIQTENDRLAKARKLLLDDAIDSIDYKTIKSECEKNCLFWREN